MYTAEVRDVPLQYADYHVRIINVLAPTSYAPSRDGTMTPMCKAPAAETGSGINFAGCLAAQALTKDLPAGSHIDHFNFYRSLLITALSFSPPSIHFRLCHNTNYKQPQTKMCPSCEPDQEATGHTNGVNGNAANGNGHANGSSSIETRSMKLSSELSQQA